MKKKMATYVMVGCVISTLLSGCGASSGISALGSAVAEYLSGSSAASSGASGTGAAKAEGTISPVITATNWNVIDKKTQYWFFECNYDTIVLEPDSADIYPELNESLKTFSKEIKEAQDNAVKAVKEDPETRNYISPGMRFFDESKISVIRADKDVFSFVGTNSSFYGGVHPNTTRSGMSFETKTGKKIALTDVVKSKKDLMPVVKDLLLSKYPDASYFDLDKSMEDYANKEEMTPVWYLTHDGIDIIFNPYDITPYAEGPKIISLTFAEYPDLFTGKYKAAEGGFVCSLSSFETMNIDINRDGKQEEIKVLGEYDDTDEMFSGVTVSLGNKSYKLDQYFLSYTAKLFHTSDGRNYLYVYTKEYNDYSTILVFELKDMNVDYKGSVEAYEMYGYYDNEESNSGGANDYEDSKYTYEEHPITNPDGFYLQRRVDALSTYSIRQYYTPGKDGLPETSDEFGDATGSITLTAKTDFTAKSVDIGTNELKDDVAIKKGDKLVIYRTNGKDTVIFVTEKAEFVGLTYNSQNEINGTKAEDLFETLFYAG